MGLGEYVDPGTPRKKKVYLVFVGNILGWVVREISPELDIRGVAGVGFVGSGFVLEGMKKEGV